MRRFEIHTNKVVAHVRARLSALMRRTRTLTRIHPGEAAAFEEAAREAFRASSTLKARTPFVSVPTAESPGSVSGAVRAVVTVSAPTAPALATAIEWAREPAAAEPPGRKPRRQAGDTAPDFLLRTPSSVTPVADDFFDGLIRQVESDR
jgi:hypothetical protein